MSTKSKARQLLELVAEVVNEPMPYAEKRQKLLDEATGEEQTALEEFASWFQGEEDR
jgi:hypothetical protein